MAILGTIYGDICGSTYEFNPVNSADEIELVRKNSFFTDDTVMTMAVADALSHAVDIGLDEWRDDSAIVDLVKTAMHSYGRMYRHRGYGGHFKRWLKSDDPKPYNSFGNGSAMRVAAAGLFSKHNLESALQLAKLTALPSHNHPEGIRGAQAVAGAIWIARITKDKDKVRDFVSDMGYDTSRSVAEIIADGYSFDETCQGSVPQAITCALEANSVDEAVRLAISLGGDADTQAAIAGGIAECLYGWPKDFKFPIDVIGNAPFRDVIENCLIDKGYVNHPNPWGFAKAFSAI